MSVVACKININGYDIASDSITVRGYTQTTGGVADGPKLFEVNDVIVGSTGKAEEVMLLRLFFSIFLIVLFISTKHLFYFSPKVI